MSLIYWVSYKMYQVNPFRIFVPNFNILKIDIFLQFPFAVLTLYSIISFPETKFTFHCKVLKVSSFPKFLFSYSKFLQIFLYALSCWRFLYQIDRLYVLGNNKNIDKRKVCNHLENTIYIFFFSDSQGFHTIISCKWTLSSFGYYTFICGNTSTNTLRE